MEWYGIVWHGMGCERASHWVFCVLEYLSFFLSLSLFPIISRYPSFTMDLGRSRQGGGKMGFFLFLLYSFLHSHRPSLLFLLFLFLLFHATP